MSSSRFPGKVLAPFRGSTVLEHLVGRVGKAVGAQNVVVATSTDASDDVVARRTQQLRCALFRGPLADLFARLRSCLDAHPCDWFFRVSADSPLLDPTLLNILKGLAEPDVDIVTNVFPRSFPRGQSGELLRAATFRTIDQRTLTPGQREHVTTIYYENPARYTIRNLESGRPDWPGEPLVVDTREDLARLEGKFPAGTPLPSWLPAARSAA